MVALIDRKILDELFGIFRYVNKVYADSKIRLFYSTPSCYGDAVKSALTEALPRKTDDFFPYSSDPHAYWTGYFTSRPTFKGLVRQTSNLLQACKQIQTATTRRRSSLLYQFQRSQAIAQHHDAVTGTAKQHVSNDYSLRLSQGICDCYEMISDSYSHLLSLNGSSLKQDYCTLLNVSQCWLTEKLTPFIVTLYNPIAFYTSRTVRLPVVDGLYTVTDNTGELLLSQMVPIEDAVLRLPGRSSNATHELIFQAVDLPPLGLRSYYVQTQPGKRMFRSRVKTFELPTTNHVEVAAFGLSLKFDHHSGHLIQVGNHSIHQQLLFYPSMAGNNSLFEFRASGAYIFRPNGSVVEMGAVRRLTTISGPITTEIRQQINSHATQIFRLHRGESFVELDWILGPIPIDDQVGKEYVSRFTASEIQNNGIFFTDSNGREILERQVNHQPTYKLNVTEPIAGNYYPVNSLAYVEDKSTKMRMTVLNDRAQGVSSLLSGSLEFMVVPLYEKFQMTPIVFHVHNCQQIHRRLLHDDAFGVGEALNETAYGVGLAVRGTHWLLLGNTATVPRLLAQRIAHPPIITFSPTTFSPKEFRQLYRMEVFRTFFFCFPW